MSFSCYFTKCQKFLCSSSKFRCITLYLANGTSKKATVVSYVCKLNQCALEIFLNFIINLSDNDSYCVATKEFISNGRYIFLGGQTAFECLILQQYSVLLW